MAQEPVNSGALCIQYGSCMEGASELGEKKWPVVSHTSKVTMTSFPSACARGTIGWKGDRSETKTASRMSTPDIFMQET